MNEDLEKYLEELKQINRDKASKYVYENVLIPHFKKQKRKKEIESSIAYLKKIQGILSWIQTAFQSSANEGNMPQGSDMVHVREYERQDGTDVSSYWRHKPGEGVRVNEGVNEGVNEEVNGGVKEEVNGGSNKGVNNLSEQTEARFNSLQSSTPTGAAAGVDKDEYNKELELGLEKYFDIPIGTLDVIKKEWDDNIKAIDRSKESKKIGELPKNNDKFFDQERAKNASWLMRKNAYKNMDRPDAKLFMDIALVGPKRVPSTQDYQFISSKNNAELNAKYNLTGNKEIPKHYDGFIFSENSPTAQALNNSQEFKDQIFSEKNFDKKTGTFKRDKLEIEFKNNKNLGYALGHMTLLKPKFRQGGFITGFVYDKYNYDLFIKSYKSEFNLSIINNLAFTLQVLHRLENYYVFIPVKVKI